MKEFFCKQYKDIALVLGYIVIASIVYGIWFWSLWHLWYLVVLVILAIIAVGITIGYFYIKSLSKDEKKDIEIKQ